MALAKWWKIDFHTHTPASNCFYDKAVSGKGWVDAAVAAGLDAVVITDHNSAEWIEEIQIAAKEVKADGNGCLTIYPGIELCVGVDFIHVIIIFDPRVKMKIIQDFITRCGIVEVGNTVKQVPIEKLAELVNSDGYDVLIVPAHFNKNKGLCKELNINGIATFASSLPIAAIEVRDDGDIREVNNKYENKAFKELPAMITGSDNPGKNDGEHALGGLGDSYTWVKLSEHSLEGLRQAFVDTTRIKVVFDGKNSMLNPNDVTHNYIAGIEFNKLKHIDNLNVRLSPHLNCIIGGRGTGKSTIIEMLNLALKKVLDKGCEDRSLMREVTLEESSIDVYYNFGMSKSYRVNARGKKNRRWVCYDDNGMVEDYPEFPVSIFSQKDIYNLADDDVNPNKSNKSPLLAVMDENIEDAKMQIETDVDKWIRLAINLSHNLRTIREEVAAIPRIKGNLEMVNSKLSIFDKTGIMKKKDNLEALDSEVKSFSYIVQELEGSISDIKRTFDLAVAKAIKGNLEKVPTNINIHSKYDEGIKRIQSDINIGLDSATRRLMEMRQALEASEKYGNLEVARKEYWAGLEQLEGMDVAQYKELEKERQTNRSMLDELLIKRAQEINLHKQIEECLDKIMSEQRKLLDIRKMVAQNIQSKAKNIAIEIYHLSHKDRWLTQIRKDLGKTNVFDEDFEAFADWLFPGGKIDINKWRLWNRYILLNDKSGIGVNEKNGKKLFSDKFEKMWEAKYNEKTINSLLAIWPEDKVVINIITDGYEVGINDGSPGQKSAAILAFIMNQGVKPLLIDQPEDDLDNSLIRELIVENIRNMKFSRQIIIVTHNPNIPVIGDAEGIIMLDRNMHGKIILKNSKKTGCIEEKTIKKGICDIMEGGISAFKWREKKYLNVEK